MREQVAAARITAEPLNREQLEAFVMGPGMGALVTFDGRVRDHDPEATGVVERLEYEAHPDAERALREIVTEFTRTADAGTGEVRIAAHHRIGSLNVGDSALIVCVAAAHRTDTFEICRDVVEQIKARVPIWKKQFSNGDGSWVGLS